MDRITKDPKRVLIVDDEPNVAVMLSASLENLGEGYVFETANSAPEALDKLEHNHYTLLITDYSMPGMTGLDLTQAVRRTSPETQIVLMTAYGTDRLRDTVGRMDLDGYIDKPFAVEEIREIVKRVVGRATQAQSPDQPPLDNRVYETLKSLRADTKASCVLLLSADGYPITVVGQTSNLDVSSVSTLVAANFLAAAELANMLGSNSSTFKSSYHEGNDYNIYSYDINGDLLLVVIFSSESKPGAVWFYTKQTAAELEPLLASQSKQFKFADEDFGSAFDAEMDQLLGGGSDQDAGDLLGLGPEDPPVPPGPHQAGPEENKPKNQAHNIKTNNIKPMTFEQAVAAGLVPRQILERENPDD